MRKGPMSIIIAMIPMLAFPMALAMGMDRFSALRLVLPVFVLLFSAAILNRNPSKVLYRATFRALLAGMTTYLCLVLLTLLCIPAAVRRWSVEQYLTYSWAWLLPFQLLLLVNLALLYFRREMRMQPDGAMMVEYISQKRAYALRAGLDHRVQAFDLLLQTEGLPKTLQYLQTHTTANTTELALLRGRYAAWQHNRDLNTAATAALQQELNRMTLTAIDLIQTT